MKTNKAIIFNGDHYAPRHDADWLRGGTCQTFCDLWNKGAKKCRDMSICDGKNGRWYEKKGKEKNI